MTDAAFDALIDATFGKTRAEATKPGRGTRAPPPLPAALAVRGRRHQGQHPRQGIHGPEGLTVGFGSAGKPRSGI